MAVIYLFIFSSHLKADGPHSILPVGTKIFPYSAVIPYDGDFLAVNDFPSFWR